MIPGRLRSRHRNLTGPASPQLTTRLAAAVLDTYEPIGTIGVFSVKGQTAHAALGRLGAVGAVVFDNGECLMDETRKYGMWAE